MYVSSDQMPAYSRIWIYQSNREFSNDEVLSVSVKTKQFLSNWTSHDVHLQASFEIRYHRFLILMIDEKAVGAGGCSIDKSVHFVQSLEKELGINLMDRMLFSYKAGEKTEVLPKKDFEQAFVTGKLNDETVVFNNLIQSKEELDSKWEVPFKESWHRNLVF